MSKETMPTEMNKCLNALILELPEVIVNDVRKHVEDALKQEYNRGKADAQEETKITFDLAIEFAEWLYQNRWFQFEDGKWHYTFEMGTSLSRNEYQKNYVKTTQQLLAKFMVQKLPSPPKEQ